MDQNFQFFPKSVHQNTPVMCFLYTVVFSVYFGVFSVHAAYVCTGVFCVHASHPVSGISQTSLPPNSRFCNFLSNGPLPKNIIHGNL